MAGGPAGSARMLTVQRPPAVPVLTFAAEPDGGPPPVLRVGGTEEFARRPAGGAPMLVLRRRADVLRTLTDSKHFGMAGVTDTGELRGCPLTGAEMQSPDGGLLNMDPPALRDYRQRINGLFTRGAAEATRPGRARTGHRAGGAAGRPAGRRRADRFRGAVHRVGGLPGHGHPQPRLGRGAGVLQDRVRRGAQFGGGRRGRRGVGRPVRLLRADGGGQASAARWDINLPADPARWTGCAPARSCT